MAFRRERDFAKRRAWEAWIGEHRPLLEQIGLPLAVYENADHWQDFLENGHLHYHHAGPPFDALRDLSIEQAERLCAVLERSYPEEDPP